MNRRQFFSFGSAKTAEAALTTQNEAAPPQSGIEPYAGEWGFEQAAHLLRRAMFSPNFDQVQTAALAGLDATIQQLFNVAYPTSGPIHTGQIPAQIGGGSTTLVDPYTAVGDSWVNKVGNTWVASTYDPTDNTAFVANQLSRRLATTAWKQEHLMTEGVSILEKMTLFWHNHFVTSDPPDALLQFRYFITLHENALGNFRDLTKLITLDPQMLLYLNGNENTNQAPNENYARELFELFTIGKGQQIAPGDYSTYTEDDIAAAAKVLTGWKVKPFSNWTITAGQVTLENSELTMFVNFFHDNAAKSFSSHFNNTVITNDGANEYLTLIDMIFQQPECARFICRKLYRWFVYYAIDDSVEANVIEPLAQVMVDHDYQIQPVVEALLRSQHFFDFINRGPMIKNPIDFMMSVIKPFKFQDLAPTTNLYNRQNFFLQISQYYDPMQMVYFSPPSVAGWSAYYQEPGYYRIWINSSTLAARFKIASMLALSVNNQGQPSLYGLRLLQFIQTLPDPTDPVALIHDSIRLLCPRDLTDTQKTYLKEALLPGLPDYEWTVEYTDYLADPTNVALQQALTTKLRQFINTLFGMPEFQLS